MGGPGIKESYIDKAKRLGASYFDLGDDWYKLTPDQQWEANTHFLDEVIRRGERVILNVPSREYRRDSILSDEIEHLLRNGYKWLNGWSLGPR